MKKMGKVEKAIHLTALSVGVSLTATAIAIELAKPKEERTWQGYLLDYIPYDFTLPDGEELKKRVWNPDGPLLSPHFMGIGWTPNLGRIVREMKELPSRND